MANTYVTISTPAEMITRQATSNKIVASGNTIKVISIGAKDLRVRRFKRYIRRGTTFNLASNA